MFSFVPLEEVPAEEVASDNDLPFSSADFADFAKEWDFKHNPSSPRYPQSNGLVERTVQTIKSLLDKAKSDKQCPYLAILEHRNTPIDSFASPAQLLMSRGLQSRLPSSQKLLVPSVIEQDSVQNHLVQGRLKQKRHYDRNARELKPLKEGEQCRVQLQPQGLWKPAIVTEHHTAPRSYIVKTEDGAEYRRNRKLLRATQETRVPISTDYDTAESTPERPAGPPEPPEQNSLDSGKLCTRSGRLVKPNRKYTEDFVQK